MKLGLFALLAGAAAVGLSRMKRDAAPAGPAGGARPPSPTPPVTGVAPQEGTQLAPRRGADGSAPPKP
jgi:hypothetical protein